MSELKKARELYTKELITWTKTWETKELIELLQELESMDRLLKENNFDDNIILFNIFDKLYKAIRDELIERLKLNYKDS